MAKQEKLYETFGELLYVLAMADGIIQEEEVTTLQEMLAEHPWAKDIEWSFNYERKKQNEVNDVYKKVIDFCKYHGPDPAYQEMIDVMQKMAEASKGVDQDEQEKMDSFVQELTQKFQKDIEELL